MPQIITFFLVIWILYLVSKRYSKKEAARFVENNDLPSVSLSEEDIDLEKECIVTFKYIPVNGQFMVQSEGNIKINKSEIYKMTNCELRLKLHKDFEFHFGMPYLGGESFKVDQTCNFEAGCEYEIKIKGRGMVFLKAKVLVEKKGIITS